jgi:hypothetical protein
LVDYDADMHFDRVVVAEEVNRFGLHVFCPSYSSKWWKIVGRRILPRGRNLYSDSVRAPGMKGGKSNSSVIDRSTHL